MHRAKGSTISSQWSSRKSEPETLMIARAHAPYSESTLHPRMACAAMTVPSEFRRHRITEE